MVRCGHCNFTFRMRLERMKEEAKVKRKKRAKKQN